MINHKIREGLSTTYTWETTISDAYITNTTTLDYLLSTPALITKSIDACCKMVDVLLPQQYITVGNKLEIAHVNPTLIGETISLTITVKKVEGNNIFFDIVGNDSNGLVCTGSYERAIVNKERLMENAYKRVQNIFYK